MKKTRMKKMEFSFDPKDLEPARRAFGKLADRRGIKPAAREVHLLASVARRVLAGERLYGKTIFRLLDWYYWEWKRSKKV